MDVPKEGEELLSIDDILDLGDECLGLKVVVDIGDNVLMGIITLVLPSSRRLTIEKVCDPKTGKRLMGMHHLLFQEIRSVVVIGVDRVAREKLMKDVYQEDKRGKQLLMKKLVPHHLLGRKGETYQVDEDLLLGRVEHTPAKSDENKDHKERDPKSLQLLPPPPPPPKVQRPEKWLIIDSIDDAFKKAISVIQSESNVCVAMEGLRIGRAGNLAWLSIATSTIIFLFDMVKMGCSKAFKSGIGDILMDRNILKIVHDCRAMEDMLHHQFSVNLNNVFDTQAAEIYLYMMNHKESSPRFATGLPSLLIRYLKLSKHHIFFSRVRDECIESDESVWFERPLSDPLRLGLARSVMYLYELRVVLLKHMLVDLNQITHLYLGSMRDKNSATVTNFEPHIVPVEIQKLKRHCKNNSIDVHDPYIRYSKDTFRLLSKSNNK